MVTLATFHVEMSVLKKGAEENRKDMFVMAETSHEPMPQSPIGEVAMQLSTAACKAAFVM